MSATDVAFAKSVSSPASLASHALAQAYASVRAWFYASLTMTVWRLTLPYTPIDREYNLRARRAARDLHLDVLERAGTALAIHAAEGEDLLTLPVFLAFMPLDVLRVWRKRRAGRAALPVRPGDSFPYPSYYLNDFHHQENGYLSLRSALTYEWQIRFLFHGANRLMRQTVIDALPEGHHLDVLDVGCGTASWVTQARLQNRRHHVTGIDLSSPYLRVAEQLRGRDTQFLQANAEDLPEAWTCRFDAVTCIWLFHELPPEAMERAAAEMARVLKPGGRLLFMDAVQLEDMADDPNAAATQEHFHQLFNEPHFLEYQGVDILAMFRRHGLRMERVKSSFLSKLLVVRKDAAC
jgi:ubiquinone/menaquinone biosynthesis C-methylase UbiE